MHKVRYLNTKIIKDLNDKMVFIGGPRQVGKTTLATTIAHDRYQKNTMYLNWDYPEHQSAIVKMQFDAGARLLIFDELHKYRQWKNYLKGLYDVRHEQYDILVTGSARLDVYRRGGDSLQGRYHYYRLHPFTLAELSGGIASVPEPHTRISFSREQSPGFSIVEMLLRFGGFPEPLFAGEMETLRRWQNERRDRLIRDDIRDIELVRDLSSLQILSTILPTKVGHLFSLNALREDLAVTHKSLSLWVDIFERFYYAFRIYPFAAKPIASLRKQPKLYLWDWSEVPDEGARFENLIASHLLKFVHYLRDTAGYRAELFFLRDTQGHEIDFLVTVDQKPWFAVEVKRGNEAPSKNLFYLKEKIGIPFVYQVTEKGSAFTAHDEITVVSADIFLAALV